MILESGGREYGDYAGGVGAGVLQANPRMLRYEHHSSRMQITLLISNMSVDVAFLDKRDLILLKMLMGWYGCAGGHVFSANEHQMLGAIGFGSDLENESPGVNLSRLGPPETRLAFIFLQQQWGCASLHWLRFLGLGGRDASLLPAHEHLHGILARARLIGVFVGIRRNNLHGVPGVIHLPAKDAVPKPSPYVAAHRTSLVFCSSGTVNCVVSVCLGSRIVVDEGGARVFPPGSIEYCLADHGEAFCRPSAIVSATEFHRWRVRPHKPCFQFIFDRKPPHHYCQLLPFGAGLCLRLGKSHNCARSACQHK